MQPVSVTMVMRLPSCIKEKPKGSAASCESVNGETSMSPIEIADRASTVKDFSDEILSETASSGP